MVAVAVLAAVGVSAAPTPASADSAAAPAPGATHPLTGPLADIPPGARVPGLAGYPRRVADPAAYAQQKAEANAGAGTAAEPSALAGAAGVAAGLVVNRSWQGIDQVQATQGGYCTHADPVSAVGTTRFMSS